MKKLFTLCILLIPAILWAQDQKPSYGITFSGFVKNDFFFDSRQVVSIREGHFLLYPSNELLDADKKDINAVPSYNFLSIQSRLTGKITGPDAFGAKTSGILEADFFGNEFADGALKSNFVDGNGFRLRHAVIKLNWEKSELLVGQYWHPMFITGCFAGTISFNTGCPMQPFSRNPQIRYTYKIGKLNIAAIASAQRDFTSYGGSTVLRNSATPELNAQIFYNSTNTETKKDFLAGVGVGYKTVKPGLSTKKGTSSYVTEETVSGLMGTAYIKYKNKSITWKVQGVYGENTADLIQLGGYVAKNVIDTTKNTVDYTTINSMSVWTDFQTNGEKIQYGLFAGYTSNLGSKDSITNYLVKIADPSIPVRGANINYVYRVAPRVVFISGKFNFAVEAEYTTAAYATKNALGDLNINANGQVTESKDISNIRILLSAIYNF